MLSRRSQSGPVSEVVSAPHTETIRDPADKFLVLVLVARSVTPPPPTYSDPSIVTYRNFLLARKILRPPLRGIVLRFVPRSVVVGGSPWSTCRVAGRGCVPMALMAHTRRWHGATAMLTLLVCPSVDADAPPPRPPRPPFTPGDLAHAFKTDGTRCSAWYARGCSKASESEAHHAISLGLADRTKIATSSARGPVGKPRRTVP